MTALAMSTPLSTLDLSELQEPSLRRVSCSVPFPTSPSSPPLQQQQQQQQPHISSISTKPTSTSALNYQAFTQVAPTSFDAWIAASQSRNQPHPHQQPQSPETPQSPLVRTSSSNPNDLFSFFQPTPRSQSLSQAPTDPSISDPSLQIDRPIPLNHLSSPPPPNSISLHTTRQTALSHAFTQSDRMIYTAPLRTAPPAPPLPTAMQTVPIPSQSSPTPASPPETAPAQTPPLATTLITPMFSAPSDGLSAVERAKKTADQFTMSQLAKKRKAAGLDPDPKRARNNSSSKSSTDDDDKTHQSLPEKISHRKYQKRLQKNRDSAFVSRIRRREYTRLLEQSLDTTEKEKVAAVNSFLEMKRRLDIVSAELSAFKQAAASNLSAVRESLFSHLPTTTTDTQPVRSGAVITSMFMFTLLFGLLLPDCIRQPFGVQRYSPDAPHGILPGVDLGHHNGIRSMLFGSMFSQVSHNINESRGKVWGRSTGIVYRDEHLDQADNSFYDGSLSALQSSSLQLLGAEHSERFLKLVKPYFEGLSSEEVAKLDDVFRYRNATHFEQLVEIEALTRKVGRQRPSESESLLEHVTLQLENTRL